MKFKIPFTTSTIDKLKKRSVPFLKFVRPRKNSQIEKRLFQADVGLSREQYISICLRGATFSFLIFFLLISTFLVILGIELALIYSLILSLLFSSFIFFSQLIYPKVYNSRRQRDIEKNLIPALEDVLVQLNSGIPLFSILVSISSADYGELSKEFKKAVRKINAGLPQADVLEELGENNPSQFFRRTLWQISNGMKAGSDISIVVRDSVKTLNEEQIIQIQNYGNKLNPVIMFYMLISVIIPALSITFMTIISSMVNLPSAMTKLLFISLFVFVVILQVIFLGVIKSLRPSLL